MLLTFYPHCTQLKFFHSNVTPGVGAYGQASLTLSQRATVGELATLARDKLLSKRRGRSYRQVPVADTPVPPVADVQWWPLGWRQIEPPRPWLMASLSRLSAGT